MKNPLRKLLAKFRRSKPALKPLLTEEQQAELAAALNPPVPVVEPPKPKGRVIKRTHAAEFNPNPARRGGRIVKVMPRQLQKMKQAQEKVEDDDQPRIED